MQWCRGGLNGSSSGMITRKWGLNEKINNRTEDNKEDKTFRSIRNLYKEERTVRVKTT